MVSGQWSFEKLIKCSASQTSYIMKSNLFFYDWVKACIILACRCELRVVSEITKFLEIICDIKFIQKYIPYTFKRVWDIFKSIRI